MIGVACKDGCGAKQLFGQHSAGQKMRPCGLAKSQKQIGLVSLGLRMAIGCTQHETAFPYPAIAPFFQLHCKLIGGEVLAFLIQQDPSHRRLRIGNAPACFRQFSEFDRPGDAFFIARDKLGLGRTGDLSAGYNVEKDGSLLLNPRLHQSPTCAPDYRSCGLRGGIGGPPHRRHRSAPNLRRAGLQCWDCRALPA